MDNPEGGLERQAGRGRGEYVVQREGDQGAVHVEPTDVELEAVRVRQSVGGEVHAVGPVADEARGAGGYRRGAGASIDIEVAVGRGSAHHPHLEGVDRGRADVDEVKIPDLHRRLD